MQIHLKIANTKLAHLALTIGKDIQCAIYPEKFGKSQKFAYFYNHKY